MNNTKTFNSYTKEESKENFSVVNISNLNILDSYYNKQDEQYYNKITPSSSKSTKEDNRRSDKNIGSNDNKKINIIEKNIEKGSRSMKNTMLVNKPEKVIIKNVGIDRKTKSLYTNTNVKENDITYVVINLEEENCIEDLDQYNNSDKKSINKSATIKYSLDNCDDTDTLDNFVIISSKNLIYSKEDWLKFINGNGKMNEYCKIYRSLYHGIEDCLREKIWTKVSNIECRRKNESQDYYNKLLKLHSRKKLVEVIEKDLKRTIVCKMTSKDCINTRNLYKINNNSLNTNYDDKLKINNDILNIDNSISEFENEIENEIKRILIAYANNNKDINYCQGMSFLVKFILLIIQDEERAFWFFTYIMNDRNWKALFNEKLEGLEYHVSHLKCVIKNNLSNLYSHFEKEGVSK